MKKNIIKKITFKIFKFVQGILLPFFLFFVYCIGFGIAYIITLFFKPKQLFDFKKNKSSFWDKAEGYEESIEECNNES